MRTYQSLTNPVLRPKFWPLVKTGFSVLVSAKTRPNTRFLVSVLKPSLSNSSSYASIIRFWSIFETISYFILVLLFLSGQINTIKKKEFAYAE